MSSQGAKGLALLGIFGGDALAFASDMNVGVVVTAITAVGGAVVGLVVLAINQIGSAKLRLQQEWERVNAGSLGRQIEEFRKQAAEDARKSAEAIEAANRQAEVTNEDNKRIRVSLHELRGEAQNVALRHTEEIVLLKKSHAEELARLNRELEVTNGELHEMRRLYTDLLRSLNAVGRKADVNADNLQVLADQVRSGDAIPVVKAPGDATS